MKDYTLGFFFGKEETKVLLMLKSKPKWQRGFYNGVGGKIENDESTLEGFVREVREELGICLEKALSVVNLVRKIVFTCRGGTVHIFRVIVLDDKFFKSLKSLTDEPVAIFPIHELPVNQITNLSWIIPLILEPTEGIISVHYSDFEGSMQLKNAKKEVKS